MLRYSLTLLFFLGALVFGGGYLKAQATHPTAASFMLGLMILCGVFAFAGLSRYLAPFLPRSIRLLGCWLYALVFEVVPVTVTFFLRPIGYLTNQELFVGAAKGRPILLIHGYLHDSSAWLLFKRRLSRWGFGPIYTINLGYPFRSICDYANQVAAKAEQIARQTGRKDLVLIGHSMGGLVSSWYATKIAPNPKDLQIITIGSPLKGTYAAYIALGANGREMLPGSSFVQELSQAINMNANLQYYHIGSLSDQIILPSSSALRGVNPEREYCVEDLGHMTLLFSPRVVKKVADWI